MDFPKWHPDATNVYSLVTGKGKDWHGAETSTRRFLYHMMDPSSWDGIDHSLIGWPRYWPNQKYPPHLYVNYYWAPWAPGRGERPWLFQCLPFDKAAYALKHNTGESIRYTWQMEQVGKSDKVETYADWWYEGAAKIADFFVNEMGVPDVWLDFTATKGGAYIPERLSYEATLAHSGFLGHQHAFRGTDTHWDPGRMNVKRIRTFMDNPQEDEVAWYGLPFEQGAPVHKFDIEWLQLRVAAAAGHVHTGGSTLAAIEAAGMTRSVWDEKMVEVIRGLNIGSDGTRLGPREYFELTKLAERNAKAQGVVAS